MDHDDGTLRENRGERIAAPPCSGCPVACTTMPQLASRGPQMASILAMHPALSLAGRPIEDETMTESGRTIASSTRSTRRAT